MKDCWIIIGNNSNGGEKVFNITNYLNEHPGGPEIILEFAGLFLIHCFSFFFFLTYFLS